MIQNTSSIIVKTIYENTKYSTSIIDLEVSKLNLNDNKDLILNIVSQSFDLDRKLEFGSPKTYRINGQKEAIEIYPEKYYNFDSRNKNFFKIQFDRENYIDQMIIFHLSMGSKYLLIFSEFNQTDIIIYENAEEISIPLKKSGIYYLEFYPINGDFDNEKFIYYFSGKIIETIDLTEKYYYGKNSEIFKSAINPKVYKVHNLINDMNVFFAYNLLNETNSIYNNPFKICVNQKC